jgi:SagB-type dehydrogenase family enzyme
MIEELLEGAEAAPSAGNLRARSYIVVTKPDLRRALAMAAFGQEQVAEASALIVVSADVKRSASRYGERGDLFALQDATAATMCLLLTAHDMGLGACWVGAFDDLAVREILDIKEGSLPVAIISLGWPGEIPEPPRRRKMEETVRWETP